MPFIGTAYDAPWRSEVEIRAAIRAVAADRVSYQDFRKGIQHELELSDAQVEENWDGLCFFMSEWINHTVAGVQARKEC